MLIHPAASSPVLFRIARLGNGHWRAVSGDGMIGGIFFDRDSAIRFARRESYGAPLRLVIENGLAALAA